ncbi:MAG: hypothetical protein JXR07_13965 [Reichenbachiella sp.]
MNKYILIFIFTLAGFQTFSQGIVKREGLMRMDQGADAMRDGNYEKADLLFREAMGMLDRLPSDLAFYFGRNSYHMKNYKQSINWLSKYIELKGTAGKFSDQASKYLEKSTQAFQKERSQVISNTEEQISNNGYYDCLSDIVTCPVCQGSGVLITPGKFGAVYQTCPISGLSGRLTCDQYNAYLRGELATKLE